jgi:hypothetical protein
MFELTYRYLGEWPYCQIPETVYVAPFIPSHLLEDRAHWSNLYQKLEWAVARLEILR